MIERFPNKYRILQTVKVRLGDAVGAYQRELVRSKAKIVLLVESSPQQRIKNVENIAEFPGNFGGAR